MKPIKIKISKQVHLYGLPNILKKEISADLILDNPIWLSNHRMGRYNRGVQRYLKAFSVSKNTLSVPIGYLEHVYHFLTENEISFNTYYKRIEVPCKFEWNAELRDFQKIACEDLSYYDQGVLQAATGSGKTVMALYMTALRKQKTLVIVHTKELADQWVDRALTFLKLDPYEIGLIGAGKNRIGRRLTVGLVQSVYKQVKDLEKVFGQIIVDECHRVPSRTFTEAVSGFCAKYTLGLSATPFRRDNLDKFISWYVGPIRHIVDKKKLIEKGHILKPIFIMRSTPFEPFHDPSADYSKMLSELTINLERNNLIVEDILTCKDDTCLILSDRKAHCETLKDILGEGVVLTGDTPKLERETIVRGVNAGKIKYLFATGQLIGEGFDCKELNVLFLTTPIRFPGRVIQYIGRIMRPGKNKKQPVVYDYADWEVKPLMNSARSRINVYGKENVKHI